MVDGNETQEGLTRCGLGLKQKSSIQPYLFPLVSLEHAEASETELAISN